jgi:hypothetical protein
LSCNISKQMHAYFFLTDFARHKPTWRASASLCGKVMQLKQAVCLLNMWVLFVCLRSTTRAAYSPEFEYVPELLPCNSVKLCIEMRLSVLQAMNKG